MKTVGIIKNFIPVICLVLFISGCKPSLEKTISAQLVIDSISSVFIPDHRMGICDIKVQKGEAGALILKGETTNAHLKEAIIKTLSNHGNKLIDSILILPDTLINRKYFGLVSISVTNIRRYPDDRSEMVSQAILGTPVKILKIKDSWELIQTPDSYLGWTESSSVTPVTVSGMDEWKHAARVITMVNSGWIYTTPGESGIVGDIVSGCILVREGESQGYTTVRLPDGRRGYVNSKAVTDFSTWKANIKGSGESIVGSALKLVGLPYLWGGTSSKAFDCSGFSKTVYYLNGLILCRDASQQALHGLNVDFTSGYDQMRKGDLLFFGSGENSKLHVTHVAIYLGDYEYINSSGRVQINSLDSARSNYISYRVTSLLAIKRIIGADGDPGIVSIKTHPWY